MASVYCRGRKVRDRGSQERGMRGDEREEQNYYKDRVQARMAIFGRLQLKNVKMQS